MIFGEKKIKDQTNILSENQFFVFKKRQTKYSNSSHIFIFMK